MDDCFIINTLTKWHEPPRARHQVAYALAKKYKVVFISVNRIGLPGFKKHKITDNLLVIIPNYFVGYRIRIRIPLINTWYQKWLFNSLIKEYEHFHIINFDFTAAHLHQFYENNTYYCNDDHIGISYANNLHCIANYHKKCEEIVCKHSKLCIATSSYLVNKLKPLQPKTFEIRLGAPDVRNIVFNHNKTNKRINLINVGFVGYLNTIDTGILKMLLSKNEFFITIIGPVKRKELEKLEEFENMRATGPLTGQSLYKEVNDFDVGIIPYNIANKIDRTPNKFWLYLSLGKPTVISNIEGIKDWRFPDKFLYRANSNADFYELIKKAFNEDSEELGLERIEYARKNSWDNRMEVFLEIYKRSIVI